MAALPGLSRRERKVLSVTDAYGQSRAGDEETVRFIGSASKLIRANSRADPDYRAKAPRPSVARRSSP